nr:hypothetical protein [Paraburkholderia sp. BL8N3]
MMAETCHLIAGLEADGFEAPHARKDYSGDFNHFACEQPTRASERSFPWQASARASHELRIQPVEATHFDGALEVKPLGGLFSVGFMEVLVVA